MTDQSSRRPRQPAPIIGTEPADLDRAADVIRRGGLVAVPTETVYGLAADAANGTAVASIYAAKHRPEFNPLICHVNGAEMAARLARISPLAQRLIDAFWPGPLTLVLPRADACPVSELATAGLDTIAIRHPKNAAITGIIERIDGPLAAPSANPSQALSPTTAAHVADALGDSIDLVIDGGATQLGIESTIVSVSDSGCVLLRPGALDRAEIETLTGPLSTPDSAAAITAPGMMKRHYAPRAKLRLEARDQQPGEAWLGFGAPPDGVSPTLNLSPSGDLREAAANLFAMLHDLDARYPAIAVAPIPDHGLGEGINDRLKRAAASF